VQEALNFSPSDPRISPGAGGCQNDHGNGNGAMFFLIEPWAMGFQFERKRI
jgi:hypothetical protein